MCRNQWEDLKTKGDNWDFPIMDMCIKIFMIKQLCMNCQMEHWEIYKSA